MLHGRFADQVARYRAFAFKRISVHSDSLLGGRQCIRPNSPSSLCTRFRLADRNPLLSPSADILESKLSFSVQLLRALSIRLSFPPSVTILSSRCSKKKRLVPKEKRHVETYEIFIDFYCRAVFSTIRLRDKLSI